MTTKNANTASTKQTTKKTPKITPPPPPPTPAPAPVENDNIVLETETPDSSLQKSKKTTRKSYTRDDIIKEFDDIVTYFETLIENIRSDNKKQSLSVAPLRTLKGKVLSLKKKAVKLIKPGKKDSGVKKIVNTNSGFLKPVNISSEMAKFTGFDSTVKYSRVDITKFLCEYIKNHGLQNPSDRRQINLDPKLSKLLKYDSDKIPLTYFQLQSHLKHHFISDGTKKVATTA